MFQGKEYDKKDLTGLSDKQSQLSNEDLVLKYAAELNYCREKLMKNLSLEARFDVNPQTFNCVNVEAPLSWKVHKTEQIHKSLEVDYDRRLEVDYGAETEVAWIQSLNNAVATKQWIRVQGKMIHVDEEVRDYWWSQLNKNSQIAIITPAIKLQRWSNVV